MKKFKCVVCKKDKINIVAYWFGLCHCEDCDKEIRAEQIKRHEKELRAKNETIE